MVIKVTNYKAIRSAELRAEGMVLIHGDNSKGKSTLLKALKSFMDNSIPESSFSFGVENSSIQVEFPGEKAELSRRKETRLEYNGELFSKMFRDPLYKVIPQFPLKRIDMEKGTFYPNLVFQDTIPLFGQADVNALFASMFGVVNKLFTRQSEVKGAIKRTKSSLEDEKNNLDKEKVRLEELTSKEIVDRYEGLRENLKVLQDHKKSYDELTLIASVNESHRQQFIGRRDLSLIELRKEELEELVAKLSQSAPRLTAAENLRAYSVVLLPKLALLRRQKEILGNAVDKCTFVFPSYYNTLKQLQSLQGAQERFQKVINDLPVLRVKKNALQVVSVRLDEAMAVRERTYQVLNSIGRIKIRQKELESNRNSLLQSRSILADQIASSDADICPTCGTKRGEVRK